MQHVGDGTTCEKLLVLLFAVRLPLAWILGEGEVRGRTPRPLFGLLVEVDRGRQLVVGSVPCEAKGLHAGVALEARPSREGLDPERSFSRSWTERGLREALSLRTPC